AEGGGRGTHRQAGEHGVGDVGRRARVRDVVAPRQLGQEGRRRRAVPQGVPLGRHAPDATLRGRLRGRAARPAAHHALRPGSLLQEPDILGRRAARRTGRDPVTRAAALAALLVLAPVAGLTAAAADPTAAKPAVRPEDLAYVYGVGAFAPE